MAFRKGIGRGQFLLFPESLDEYVSEDSPVRLIDAFVERLDLGGLKFKGVSSKDLGRPSHDPRDLLKILIYGYFYGALSSRRMERESKVNVEVMWLTDKLTPDHDTISEFRKMSMKPMFSEFNRFCLDLNMFSLDYVSIDGSKFRAVNSKDRNFTLSKLDDRLKRLDPAIDEYLAALEESDGEEDGRSVVDITYEYEEAAVTEEMLAIKTPEDLRVCLHSGAIPKCMEGILSEARVEEVVKYHRDATESDVARMTPEEMMAKAHGGYFVRDAERNLVICPQVEVLRSKSVKRNGDARYCNRLARKRCIAKCAAAKFKEADFPKDRPLKKAGGWKREGRDDDCNPCSKAMRKETKVVRFNLKLDEKKMDNRRDAL